MSAKETMTAPGLVAEVENVSHRRGVCFVELSVRLKPLISVIISFSLQILTVSAAIRCVPNVW